MKKHLKKIRAVILITGIVFQLNSCAKKTETPEQKCRTCIAKDNIEGASVDQQEVCSDEAEQAFRNTNSGLTVTCQ